MSHPFAKIIPFPTLPRRKPVPAPTVDITTADPHAVYCEWCGEESDTLRRYGTVDDGRVYWSPALCSDACHAEMYGNR